MHRKVKLLLMKYFETLRLQGNVTFFAKGFCRFVAVTTPSLKTLTNPAAAVIITYARVYLEWPSTSCENS